MFTLIASIFVAILGAVVTAATTQTRNRQQMAAMAQQQKYNEENMATQFGYNEKAADNADARQRAQFWDLYSPQARVQQYKDAGLSVGMMYGGGGVGGSGGSATGASGGGVGLPSIGMPSLETPQLAGAMSDIMNAFSGASLNSKHEGKVTAEENKIIEEANNEKERRAGIKAEAFLRHEQARLTKAQAGIAEATGQTTINLMLENLREAKWKNDLNDEQKEYLLEQVHNMAMISQKEILLKDKELGLSDLQAQELAEKILNIQADTQNKKNKQGNWQAELEARVSQWAKENGKNERELLNKMKATEISRTSGLWSSIYYYIMKPFEELIER